MTVQMHATMPTGSLPSQSIYVLQEGIYLGPYTEKEVRRHWANGTLRDADFLWQEGMGEWMDLRSYFGLPAPLIADTKSGRLPAAVPVRPAARVIPLAEEVPSFYYQAHPAAATGWVAFVSWSLLGVSMLTAAVYYQRPALVGTVAAISVIMALIHLIRNRSGSSVGILIAAVVLPALVWCLAVAILPPPNLDSSDKGKVDIITTSDPG